MLTDFNEMSPNSRVWIYQANGPFTEASKGLVTEKLNQFLTQWESHGNPLKASWKLFYDLFLVVAVDETHYPASGCSIDKSVNFLKELEAELGTEILGKTSVAILEKNGISTFGLKDLKKSVEEGKITPDSIIFNNLVPTLGELNSNWKQPAKDSWLSRYFSK